MVSIHIKDFDLHFGTNKDSSDEIYPFLLQSEDSIVFLKLYLVTHS